MSKASSPEARTGGRKRFHIVQQFDNALIEAKIAQAPATPAVFDQERAVARHAGHDFLVGIHFADVPETGDQNAAIGGRDHFFQRWLFRPRSRC
jgi:hypothetical protein